MLLDHDRGDESKRRGVVGEDPDDSRATLDLGVDPLQGVGRPDLDPVGDREVGEGGEVCLGVEQHGRHLGELALQGLGHFAQLAAHVTRVGLGEDRADGGRHHRALSLHHPRQDVAHEVHPAALPGGAQQDLADRGLEARVVATDHERDAVEAPSAQVAQEVTPEGLVLAVAQGESQDLAVAVEADPGRDHDGPRDHSPAHAGLDVGGVEEDVGEGAVGEAAGAELLESLVHLRADPRDLALGEPGLDPQSAHQVVDLAGGDPVDVGLDHDGVEGLVDASPALEHARKERALAQLGDLQVHVAGPGRERAGTVPVATRRAGPTSLVGLGADSLSRLGLDQRLIEEADHLAHQIEVGTLSQRVEQLGWVKIVVGHRSFLSCLAMDTSRLLR